MKNTYIIKQVIQLIHTEVRKINSIGEIEELYGNTPAIYDPFQMDKDFLNEIVNRKVKPFPDVFFEFNDICYGLITLDNDEKVVIGPVRITAEYKHLAKLMVEKHNISNDNSYILPYCELSTFLNGILLLNCFLTGQELYLNELRELNGLAQEEIPTAKKQVSSIIFHHRETEVPHNPFDHEVRKLGSIERGDVNLLRKYQKEVWAGELGKVAYTPLRQAKNMAIIVIVLASRAAIRGGISPELAFSMADGFILTVEAMNSVLQIQASTSQFEVEFLDAVKQLNKKDDRNLLVEKAKDYIFKQLHQSIRIAEIGKELCVNKEYLSSVFSKKEGVTLQHYILNEKIKQSEEFLRYTDYKIYEIANYLAFSSQSHFGQCFKKINGMTPQQYRNKYAKR